MNRVSKFARSPQGQKLARKAQDYARSPEGRRKLEDARRRLGRQR